MNHLERPIRDFRGRPLPEPGILAGYAALIDGFDLRLPLPPRLAAIATRHHPTPTTDWLFLAPRYQPRPTFEDHLGFALKREGIDLAVLSALFRNVDAEQVRSLVRAKPTGSFSRKVWFLYEWLTGRELDVPPLGSVRLTPVVDERLQFALRNGVPSSRHKVVDNLPGTAAFCPLIRRTPTLLAVLNKKLDEQARAFVGRTRKDLMARAAAFLLLKDSKSSFAIEGEKPSGSRAARWGQAIAQAGSRPLELAELERLQKVVIGDSRFVPLGLRREGGFVGVHDLDDRQPVPDHISARWQDLPSLMEGVVAYGRRAIEGGFEPVAAAAALAFGFVYIHPFVDGNGRLHRWLIHHMLAASEFTPTGLVFPISPVILQRLPEYRAVLESYSAPLLPWIEWRATQDGNVEVLDDNSNFYRYFDATAHAEFLYACVEQTVEKDLPDEVRFLEAFDRFSAGVQEIVDMPGREIEKLRGFLQQGVGKLSKRARQGEFAALSDEEAAEIEGLYKSAFAFDLGGSA